MKAVQILATSGLVQLLFGVTAVAQSAITTPIEVEIRVLDKCLDVPGGNSADGIGYQTWGCHNGPNQRWLLLYDSSGYFQVKSVATGKCITDGGPHDAGPDIQQRRCNQLENQLWQFRASGSDSHRLAIFTKGRTECWYVEQDNQLSTRSHGQMTSQCQPTTAGDPVLYSRDWQRRNFEFVLRSSAKMVSLIETGRNDCVDVPGGSRSDGTILQVFPCNQGKNQQWQLDYDNNSFAQIRNPSTSKCLTWPQWGGPAVEMGCDSASDRQRWYPAVVPGGNFMLLTKKAACLALPTISSPQPLKDYCYCLSVTDRRPDGFLGDGRALVVSGNCDTTRNDWRLTPVQQPPSPPSREHLECGQQCTDDWIDCLRNRDRGGLDGRPTPEQCATLRKNCVSRCPAS